MSVPLWQQMTDEQLEALRKHELVLKVERDGYVRVTRVSDRRSSVALSPRRAIENLSRLEAA